MISLQQAAEHLRCPEKLLEYLVGIQMERDFKFTVVEEDGVFVASCAEPDLASEGDTEEEALANLKEAVELYFEVDGCS